MHRSHGRLESARYVPGGLFSVNEATVRHLPRLFARNERLVCHVDCEHGPMVLIFVGALHVGTINCRFTGDLKPRATGVVDAIDNRDLDGEIAFDKGETLGWFNMGSTVILLFPPGTTAGLETLVSGQTVRMGEALGHLSS